MDSNYECRKVVYNHQLINAVFTTPEIVDDDTPSFQPQVNVINFKFSHELIFSEWVPPQDSDSDNAVLLEFVRELRENDDHFISLTYTQFLRPELAYEIMEEGLRGLNVSDECRRGLVEGAWKEAWERFQENNFEPSGHKVLELYFNVVEEHEHVFPRELLIIESCSMIPAARYSIQSLERVGPVHSGSCAICLEELSGGGGGGDGGCCEALSMPCSHVFHGDCIETWLMSSHYCPLCRFEMPTS